MGHRKMTEADRYKLEALYNAKMPVREIASALGFSKVTIYAEIKRGAYQHRNTDWTETRKYSAYKAQRDADYNATAKGADLKIGNDHELAKYIEDMILKGYSPQAVLDEIKRQNLQFDTTVCRTTLYSYIDKGVFKNITNKNLLRKWKRKKRKTVRRGKTQPHIEHSIEKRPKEVQERTTFGHWEFDSVIGKREKGKTLLVFTERYTRMQLIFVSKDKTALSTLEVINAIERKLGSRNFRRIFKTMTCDNGTEFSCTQGIEYSPITGRQRTSLYYCHSFSSWERGSNENQNGFIRRYIPKGTPISNYSRTRIREIQDFINDYPRGIFGGASALDRFQIELQKLGINNNSVFF